MDKEQKIMQGHVEKKKRKKIINKRKLWYKKKKKIDYSKIKNKQQIYIWYINESFSNLACNVYSLVGNKSLTQFPVLRPYDFRDSFLNFFEERNNLINKFKIVVIYRCDYFKFRTIDLWIKTLIDALHELEEIDIEHMSILKFKKVHNGIRLKKKKENNNE